MSIKQISVPVKNGTAVVCCPACNMRKEINATVKVVKAKCPKCGEQFSISFYSKDRKFFRKTVSIEGQLNGPGGMVLASIIIKDLSCQGAKFSLVHGRAELEAGQRINLEFFLTDKKSTEINVFGIIRRINDDKSYSIEFVDVNEYSAQMKAIGFWMR